MLTVQILDVEQINVDSLIIVLDNFNKSSLNQDLPSYYQLVKCPPREKNILDHCYTSISNAYHARPRAALEYSDHVIVYQIAANRQK